MEDRKGVHVSRVREGLQPGGETQAWGVTAVLGRIQAAGSSLRPGSSPSRSPDPAPR